MEDRSIKKVMKLKNYLALVAISLAPTVAYAAAAVEEPKKSLWEHSIALGLTVTKGNSDTVTANANWLSLKKWDKNELRLGADGTYGESEVETTDAAGNKDKETETTAQSGRVFGQYNRLFTERLFGYLRAELYHDDIADIEYRVMLSPGLGYYFVKTPNTQLSAEIGPGWVYEKKGGEKDDYFTLRIAERFEHKFNDRVRLWQSLEFLPQVDDWENFIINAELGVESSLSKHLSIRVFVQDTYQNRPAEGREENDVKLVAALAYKF
jgi:putative salt-induced outer membrane protein YdiY